MLQRLEFVHFVSTVLFAIQNLAVKSTWNIFIVLYIDSVVYVLLYVCYFIAAIKS